ncbi:unnamed protein product, partial [Timema podura]|nr:unnamed protein product [Timema podura]
FRTSLTSIVDYSLNTWDEKRVEKRISVNNRKESSLYFGRSCDMVHFVARQNQERESTSISLENMEKLVGEGANLILLRQMAVSEFDGDFSTSVILTDGRLLSCVYTVRQDKRKLVVIDRVIKLDEDKVDQ